MGSGVSFGSPKVGTLLFPPRDFPGQTSLLPNSIFPVTLPLPLHAHLTYGLTLKQKSLARWRRPLLLRRRGCQGLRKGWSDLRVATLAPRAARQIPERILQLSEFLVPEPVGLGRGVRCR